MKSEKCSFELFSQVPHGLLSLTICTWMKKRHVYALEHVRKHFRPPVSIILFWSPCRKKDKVGMHAFNCQMYRTLSQLQQWFGCFLDSRWRNIAPHSTNYGLEPPVEVLHVQIAWNVSTTIASCVDAPTPQKLCFFPFGEFIVVLAQKIHGFLGIVAMICGQ